MSVTQAVGWALLHSLWQDALAAVGLASLFVIVPTRAARTRYALAIATMGLMVALPLTTGVRLHGASHSMSTWESGTSVLAPPPAPTASPASPAAPPSGAVEAGPAGARSGVAPVFPAAPFAARISAALDPAMPWFVLLWFGGVLVMSLRLASGWLAVRRLWTTGTHPVPEGCEEALGRLVRRLRVTRPVRVFQSALVQVPAVIGWLRPVILLPASALTGLTPLQLDALLAHELAHVRRYDYLVNLLQSAVETLLFYHPAAWWVSRRVREEREHCCDDLAVAACGGDAHVYAMALLGMEQLRLATPPLALAAGGGSLIGRVQRLMVPAQVETFPRWMAGLVVAALVVTIGGGTTLAARAEALDAGAQLSASDLAADATRTAPDTVLRYAGPARPLADRWDWASAQARRLGTRRFWVGYSVHGRAVSEHPTSLDGERRVTGREDGGFRGVRLAPLVGAREDADDIAFLFRYTTRADGRPVPTRAHVSSLALPVEFGGGALLWLGAADDDASLHWVQALFAEAATRDLKESLIAAVGLHASTGSVVPILERWLQGEERASVRAEAAEWLGHEPDPAAVSALSRAARSDPASHVRRQAAEALGDNPSAAATDSLIALARTLHDPDARREAVEELGRKSDPQALAALIAVARSDDDEDVRDQAIKALGRQPRDAARAALVDLARTHSSPDARREAVEAVGKYLPGAQVVPVLGAVAREDRDVRVQRAAVKALGPLHDHRAFALLVDLARHHPAWRVRREAVARLGEQDGLDSAQAVLEELALNGPDDDLQKEAVETLSRIPDTRARHRLARLARAHPSDEVRREAVEEYAEAAAPETALVLLTDRLANDQSPEVQAKALHRLAQLPDGIGIPALIECARTHPNRELRGEARRLLSHHDDRP